MLSLRCLLSLFTKNLLSENWITPPKYNKTEQMNIYQFYFSLFSHSFDWFLDCKNVHSLWKHIGNYRHQKVWYMPLEISCLLKITPQKDVFIHLEILGLFKITTKCVIYTTWIWYVSSKRHFKRVLAIIS